MFKDYPLNHNHFGCVGIGQSWGFSRGQDFSRPCSCLPQRQHFPCPPFPPQPPFPGELSFSFRKLDACTDAPLAGAVFELSRNCQAIGSAVSPASGEITFSCLAPGRYILREIAAPPGYRLDTAVNTVDVCPNGMVALNGELSRNFSLRNFLLDRSLSPQMNPITVDATYANGAGVAGCQIDVVWPGGEMTSTAVNSAGTWAVSRPDALTLEPGDIVRARQVCPERLASEDVFVGVTL